MRQRYWILLTVALLIWSFFARGVYEFGWVVARRASEAVSVRTQPEVLRQDRSRLVDRATEQADEIDRYLDGRRIDPADPQRPSAPASSRQQASSSDRFEHLRHELRKSLRYPPTGVDLVSAETVLDESLGADELATYRAILLPTLPGVHASGVYLRPRAARDDQRLPLLIAAQGRIGPPGQSADGKLRVMNRSRRDLAWDAIQRGYAVWLPDFVHFRGDDIGVRDRLTVRAWESGESLLAIEIAKVVTAIDYFSSRADIDPSRIAMLGFSYGGFYALYTAALEPRLRAAAVLGYFNDRQAVLDASGPVGYLDWRFDRSRNLWRDPVVASLVAPRALIVQAGVQDQLFPIAGARRAAEETRRQFVDRGADDRFAFDEFVGRHEFDVARVLPFIDRALDFGPAQAPAGRAR
ncbi:conserved hypothetical protein [Burkholderiales bacterium 8X]|nr:conserved hypothetical protein [Burkholderiales bacterium 8X]